MISHKKHLENQLSHLRVLNSDQVKEIKALTDQVASLREKESRLEKCAGNLQGRLNNLQYDLISITAKVSHLALEMSVNKQHALSLALDNIHKMLEAARHKSCTISS